MTRFSSLPILSDIANKVKSGGNESKKFKVVTFIMRLLIAGDETHRLTQKTSALNVIC